MHTLAGYQLGELNEWSKKTNTELAVRVPLIVRVPWKAASMGQRTSARAELVDLFRTLVDLATLNSSDIPPDVQGVSLAPLFDNPSVVPPALLKSAFSQIGSCACKNYTQTLPSGEIWTGLECNKGRCAAVPTRDFDFMGYTQISPEGWRYVLWAQMDRNTSRVDFSQPTFEELYDLRADGHQNFDFDAYSLNVAPQNPALCSTFKAATISAVKSWY
jgi:iduronate 2-sulfatase